MTTNKQQQEEELLILKSILGDAIVDLDNDNIQFEIDVEFQLATPFYLNLIHDSNHLSTLIQNLPPLILTIHFHDEYPSSQDSPTFVLSSCYLSCEFLQKMCQKLDEVWEQNLGQPIVYQWIECLKEEFSLIHEICLSNQDVYERDDSDDEPRAMSTYQSDQAPHVYEQLIEYNQIKEFEKFLHGYHECSICMSNNIPGRDMIRLYKCNHAFCRNCLHDYAQIHINTGSVEWLYCPDSQCQLSLLPAEIKLSVNDDRLYHKYEQLLLQKTLEQMQDIFWCPRCQHPVLTGNEKDNLALCDQCRFAFCKKCKKTYHSQTLCGHEAELAELKRKRRKLRDQLQDLNMVPDDEEKLIREFLAIARIENSTRLCPNPLCQVPIEKNLGCDHMYCIRCRKPFNWSEAADQTTDTKVLFEKYESDINKMQKALQDEKSNREDSDENMLLQEPTIGKLMMKRIKKCPNTKCGKICIKYGNNNYLICQHCKRSFCFSCGNSIINPKQHFGVKCKRQSTV
ncbi:unnamed protein product [Rotaria socialis]|uniref:RBR-type E3 ubiquitin transferase n=1 Tax=Rotaria socialis TaxID=392032 RepID=A0A818X7K6_9BILA|nr:unnamed protein product [Rotaria socialis]CAF4686878.1 unnamed protein product [Rotaria socialis]